MRKKKKYVYKIWVYRPKDGHVFVEYTTSKYEGMAHLKYQLTYLKPSYFENNSSLIVAFKQHDTCFECASCRTYQYDKCIDYRYMGTSIRQQLFNNKSEGEYFVKENYFGLNK